MTASKCPRCRGAIIYEEYEGIDDTHCIMCGWRRTATLQQLATIIDEDERILQPKGGAHRRGHSARTHGIVL